MNLLENTKLLWFGEAGRKERTSTIYKFLTKAYDASFNKDAGGNYVANENHLVQTTELNQPYLRGNIAPNEVLCAYNGNGEDKYLTHPEIAFATDEAWSLAVALNWNGSNDQYEAICGKINAGTIRIKHVNNVFRFSNSTFTEFANGLFDTSGLIGKNPVIHFVADGNGTLFIKVNSILVDTLSVPTDSVFSELLYGKAFKFSGSFKYYRIQQGAMTATQVADEAAMIRTWLPEVESVVIGAQEWATSNLDIVCTPEGNVIPEMQLAADEEKITVADDRDFTSDTGFWSKSHAGITISAGKLNFDGTQTAGQGIDKGLLLTIGIWYKVDWDIDSISSGEVKPFAGSYMIGNYDSPGSKSGYIKATSTTASLFNSVGGTISACDNLSWEEIGWAGLGDLYTWLTTTGGYSVADALKEVAAWCHYNNDPANGAIYGKLYNWYAAKLLQDDIDAYDIANPATPWGWKVPTEAEMNTLTTTLGGTAVAGGKLKMTGEDYWDTPNTGADNDSGFTALAGGRNGGAVFLYINLRGVFWVIDAVGNYYAELRSDSAGLNLTPSTIIFGYSIRLIKS